MNLRGVMKKNTFIEGAVIATVSVIITKILGMLYVIPFYKIIGTKGGALYSYAYNIYTIFLGISSAGIPTAISKIISEYNTLGYEEAKYRTFKIGTKIIGYMSTGAFLVMFVFADLIAVSIIGNMSGGNTVSDIAFVIRCISFAVLVIPYVSVTRGFIQGHKIITPASISGILEQIVRIFVILSGSFLAYKIFSSSLTLAVGIAVSGAFFGGVAAYIYLRIVIKKNVSVLGIKEYKTKNKIEDKEIIKKIIYLSFPFIIINIASSIYNFTDMILLLRGLNILGYSTLEAEFIQSAMTTWSNKFCMIISSFAMGMGVSLIPHIVSSYVKGNWVDVCNKMNKAYQIVLVVSIPCAVGICILAKPIWNVFYGANEYGYNVLRAMILSAVFANLYNITFNTMQSLNRYKVVYLSVFLGFIVNAFLDIPLTIIFKKFGLPPYWGVTASSIIGYCISIKTVTRDLKRSHNMSYKTSYKAAGKIIIPTSAMILVLILFNYVVKFNLTSTFQCILMIVFNVIIGGTVYLFIANKLHLFYDIIGEKEIRKVLKKLTLRRVSLDD